MECAGAPVFGPDGTVMGAISVSSLYKPRRIMKLWDARSVKRRFRSQNFWDLLEKYKDGGLRPSSLVCNVKSARLCV